MAGVALRALSAREEIRLVAIIFPAVVFALVVAYLAVKRRFKR